MRAESPPKAKRPGGTGRLELLEVTSDDRNRSHCLASLQGNSITVPIPGPNTPFNAKHCQNLTAVMALRARTSRDPRHTRALLAHLAGIGVRIGMAVCAGDGGNNGGGVDLLADTANEDDSRPCAGCRIEVTNENLGGWNGHGPLSGALFCTSCADGKGGEA